MQPNAVLLDFTVFEIDPEGPKHIDRMGSGLEGHGSPLLHPNWELNGADASMSPCPQQMEIWVRSFTFSVYFLAQFGKPLVSNALFVAHSE